MTEPVLIVGAGIAGLTAALALAKRGISVRIFEQAERLEEAGAGLQLSPNATRILIELGLGEALKAVASQPERVALIDARSSRELATVRLGQWAEARWGAPYYVLHRADLQRVLLEAVASEPRIALTLGTRIESVIRDSAGLSVVTDGQPVGASFLIGADGVRSRLRRLGGGREAQPSGFTAWRATFSPDQLSGLPASDDHVTAFVHPRVHCIAYPVRGGQQFNLAGFSSTRGECGGERDFRAFADSFAGALPALAQLAAQRARWSAWDVKLVRPIDWGAGASLALIGDAAHATTPFAAQGAAMAIEDAATLAMALASHSPRLRALDEWRRVRTARVNAVIKRGRLNRLAWHAAGPVAWVRDRVLARRTPEALAADLDWLYGWRIGDS
ncbi:FAD-dependent monooxygenase [Mesorhizobium sp. RP14(2022)]|uniref:FAD-dependent monooxygenase n=1 Tax=Mesorhizobium liriopis TaxID=2953882 RepID=A0ABT1C7J7_9HYPH|nr:FAD-dependent oxidoreductase [Mesorhizobium liriopis]MCO6050805.1 FAD-dependent monooxygenase [Mesorhizobium liriopis]